MQAAIELSDIHKSFGAKSILRGVNLRVPREGSTVIIGESGTGKSVLLKLILGLLTPDKGEIRIGGEQVQEIDRPRFFENFGMLFQSAALFDSLRVWENIAFREITGRHKMKRADARDLACENLKRVGLDPRIADQFPAELSGGMKKRVGLARAIMGKPSLIFFDEPTSGLDPVSASRINALISELVADIGASALVITHDMGSVRMIADHVVMLHEGRTHWTGRPDEMEHSGNAELARFIGASGAG